MPLRSHPPLRFVTLTLGLLLALGPSATIGLADAAHSPLAASRPGWHVVVPQRPQPLFHVATGIAVDRQRNVYVSDVAEGRVKKFSPQGRLLASWGSDAPSNPLRWYPRGVAVSGSGLVYVLDNGIVKLSTTGRLLGRWSAAGAEVIAVGGSGDVFALSTEKVATQRKASGRIDKFSPSGALLATWHTPSLLSDGVHNVDANGLAVDPRGNLYVTVALQDNTGRTGPFITSVLYKLSPTGALLSTVAGGRVPLGPVQAADAASNVYLAPDTYAGAIGIEKLSPASKLLARWTAAGRTTLSTNLHLALDGRGHLYVADAHSLNGEETDYASSGLIHILTTGGRSLAQWGRILPNTRIDFGVGMTVGPHGAIYATAANQHVFLTVSPAGTPVPSHGRTVHYLGHTSNTAPFIGFSPSAIALGPQGNVYVLDSLYGAIDLFSPGGQLLRQWQVSRPAGEFLDGLAVDRAGNMYTLLAGRIVKLSPSGKILARFGSIGHGPGQFEGPKALALDAAGNIYVADTFNNRIQKLSPAGKPLAAFGSAELDRPGRLAVGTGSHVFVLDTSHPTVFEYGPTGALLATHGVQGVLTGQLFEPAALAVGRDGTVYVLDYGNDRIQKLVR